MFSASASDSNPITTCGEIGELEAKMVGVVSIEESGG
jgi:hypothetical protein